MHFTSFVLPLNFLIQILKDQVQFLVVDLQLGRTFLCIVPSGSDVRHTIFGVPQVWILRIVKLLTAEGAKKIYLVGRILELCQTNLL